MANFFRNVEGIKGGGGGLAHEDEPMEEKGGEEEALTSNRARSEDKVGGGDVDVNVDYDDATSGDKFLSRFDKSGEPKGPTRGEILEKRKGMVEEARDMYFERLDKICNTAVAF